MIDVPYLNYHHLHYFWAIAAEGSITRAASRLNVSPSSLSVQLKALEDQLGQQLFARRGKGLQLTEAGRIALDYANTVFQTGHHLVEAMSGLRSGRQLLRIGAAATLSRNFQINLFKPLMGRNDVELIVRSGLFHDLVEQLDMHKLDIVLANQPTLPNADAAFDNTLLAEQPVSIVGPPAKTRSRFRFPESLSGAAIVVPGRGSALRSAFDALLGRKGVKPLILAEVDDMAMLRLMARERQALTLVPPVVVVDELRSGFLVERCKIKALKEQFFAITQHRRFPNPLVSILVSPQKGRIL